MEAGGLQPQAGLRAPVQGHPFRLRTHILRSCLVYMMHPESKDKDYEDALGNLVVDCVDVVGVLGYHIEQAGHPEQVEGKEDRR